MNPRFTPQALAFLRSLKRNNDRDWFRDRKDQYELLLRGPMVQIIDKLRSDFASIAPNLLADPKRSLFRPYRDTRFSADKSPIKTHVAAVFPSRGLPKLGGAALYFHVAPDHVWVGGGLHAPGSPQLLAVRSHLAVNFRRFRAIVESPAFRRAGGLDDTLMLRRVPRGFASDHPAATYLRYRQFIAGREFPAAFAASPRFYTTGLLATFRLVAPLVNFLNEPLLTA